MDVVQLRQQNTRQVPLYRLYFIDETDKRSFHFLWLFALEV